MENVSSADDEEISDRSEECSKLIYCPPFRAVSKVYIFSNKLSCSYG